MQGNDSLRGRAELRIEVLTAALGVAAASFALYRWGWRAAVGLLLGAMLSWINFRWLTRGVDALVLISIAQHDVPRVRVPKQVYLKFFGRFALLLGVVYVILSRSLLPAAAVLGGLFAVVVAVLLEMSYQLIRNHDGVGETD